MTELERYKANLEKLKLQAAMYGMAVPLALQNDIEYHEQKIKELYRNSVENRATSANNQTELYQAIATVVYKLRGVIQNIMAFNYSEYDKEEAWRKFHESYRYLSEVIGLQRSMLSRKMAHIIEQINLDLDQIKLLEPFSLSEDCDKEFADATVAFYGYTQSYLTLMVIVQKRLGIEED